MSRLTIGSFNVLNLKTDAKSSKNADFKAEKVKRIAAIIKQKAFDIVCLQEVQSDDTVSQIVRELNGNSTVYDYKHCGSIYEELSGEYPYKSGVHSELALVWNTGIVALDKDLVVYKGIHDQFLRVIDKLVTTMTSALAVIATAAASQLATSEDDKNETDEVEEGDDTKKRKGVEAGVAGGAGTLALAGYLGHERLREEIEGVLRNTLRPPLVGLFRLVNGGSGENTQIRVINVHSQFAKTKYDKIGGVALRKLEASFVLGDIFRIVESQRGGDSRTARTIVCGDFNLKSKHMMAVLAEFAARDMKRNEELRKLAQTEKTTWKLVNGKAVRSGEEPPEYELANDYDHFVFRTSCWDPADASRVEEDDLFFLGHKGEAEYKPISDHYPISITTEKI